ncbi:ABC transporter ATP-binding protein [Ferruginibacter paludis]|uniref:ABC transporter ATP-binding protein n=1 Tax=Ferruginibacter paludis TaxID=1310417 RepID=UPI0025B5CCA4|nr:ABC transporter ATP-binding protein [Ferruginibacter paludis]MDN3656729.1 ABC transporter ATP-binding protein [Ferruginibacter paludis]
MSQNIIEAEGLSKLYKLGSLGSGTISHDLNRWWNQVRKKEDPYHLTAEKNDRNLSGGSGYVWSLKDINFEVKQGEIFGIIGSNGAGKSTLLKLLSKITKPTDGTIRLDGRVASLLEVGTGFHPELTGRENVFLNGAVLGMRRQEIKDRFDEIVEFSGIGRYIDTPVKKYSSGMYVRLAFAVAAHLEPDILIIDEVLAVGDAAFQAKCLGKMKDVSRNQGRTVLFVSHSIPAIKQLCNRALLLEHGLQKAVGDMSDILALYQQEAADMAAGIRGNIPASLPGYFTDWQLQESKLPNKHACYTGDTCIFSFGFTATESLKNCEIIFAVRYDGLLIMNVSSGTRFSVEAGKYRFNFKVDFPVRDAKLDVEVTCMCLSKKMDSWIPSTKLTVLNNFDTHLYAGVINPDTEFFIERQPADVVSNTLYY